MSVTGTSVVKSHCPKCVYVLDTTLGERVEDPICVLDLDLEPKMTSTIRCCDVMTKRECDIRIGKLACIIRTGPKNRCGSYNASYLLKAFPVLMLRYAFYFFSNAVNGAPE